MDITYPPEAEAFRERVRSFLGDNLPAGWTGLGGLPEGERETFRVLTSVQGVGGRVALAILSTLSPDELSRAVANEDKAMIGRANGVGPKLAARIANALDYVGVMGVELFVTAQGLIVNEIAPRVHNSGHWTQAGCAVDQFEQHIRAVASLPLGDGRRYADVRMENLIGDDLDRVPDLLGAPNTQVHLYGKGAARPGRKMGHVNRITG